MAKFGGNMAKNFSRNLAVYQNCVCNFLKLPNYIYIYIFLTFPNGQYMILLCMEIVCFLTFSLR